MEGGQRSGWQRKCWLENIRMDVSAYARTAHKGLLQKILEEDLYWVVPYVPPMTPSVKGLNWDELNSYQSGSP